jgi:acetoin utilization protein AcuC
LYPGTGYVHEIGSGAGRGFTVNCPLLPGTGRDSYQYIFDQVIFPLTEEFGPQIILRNGGSDPYWNDQLTHLGLIVLDFRKIGENVREMAEVCGGREIDMIGSGYNKEVLPRAWFALICGLADIKVEIEEPVSIPQEVREDPRYEDTRGMVRELRRNLKSYWKCLAK